MTAKEVMSDSNSHEIKATKVSKVKDRQQGDRKNIKDAIFAKKHQLSIIVIEITLSSFNVMERTPPSELPTNHPMDL